MPALESLIKNEYFISLLILLFSILIAKLIHLILKRHIKIITQKTKSDLDDIILNIITKPLYLVIILFGIFLSLKYISLLSIYGNIIENIFFIAYILIFSYIIAKILALLVSRWLKVQKRFEKTPKLISRFISVIIYAIAILMILDHFEVEITPLIATLGIGGLAVGLALQNTLTNFFAGLHLISDKPINVGDFIELPDAKISGYVDDIGWRSTRIKTLPNNIVVVPNSKLAESIIINDSMPEKEMAALVQCGVSYESNLKKVEKVTIDVAKKIQQTVPGAVKTFEPFIRYHTFGDSNINFTVILRVESFVDQYLVTHEFIKALKERYDKEGIEISWPVRKIYTAK